MLQQGRRDQVRVIEPGTNLSTRLRDLVQYRELITNLVRKELRIKYKNSFLGFLWSLVNPALTLAIFWLVFTKFLGQQIPDFAIFLLSGLLGWNLFSASLNSSVTSLIGNANLVTKVYFPREVLPLASIGAALMHFFFQFIVLTAAVLVFRYPIDVRSAVILVPSALVVELVLLAGACLIVSVLNVYFRDVQHLLEVGLLAWFWMTPIVYPIAFLRQNLGGLWRLTFLNPMTSIALAYQRGIYHEANPIDDAGQPHAVLIDAPLTWYLRNLAVVMIGAVVLAAIGWTVFRRLESRLAEEL